MEERLQNNRNNNDNNNKNYYYLLFQEKNIIIIIIIMCYVLSLILFYMDEEFQGRSFFLHKRKHKISDRTTWKGSLEIKKMQC
jgi:hypothetical protein